MVSSPYWLYQIWAFILPGLHANERKWSQGLRRGRRAAVRGRAWPPATTCCRAGLEVLIGFTPAALENLVEFGEYFSFFTRMLLVFGIAFEIPLFVILLNLAGVVPGRALAEYRPWIILGTFVFAAVATPSTDPFSMLMLALPMTVLFIVSEVIARLIDRRRARRRVRSSAATSPTTSSRRSTTAPEQVRTLATSTRTTECAYPDPAPRPSPSTPSTCPSGWGSDEVRLAPRGGARDAAGAGRARAAPARPDAPAPLACDVLACDRAYPEPALPESWRREAHAQWALQQVLLLEIAGRLTLVCPGVDVEVDSALESLRRLAKAVGAPSARFTAALRL